MTSTLRQHRGDEGDDCGVRHYRDMATRLVERCRCCPGPASAFGVLRPEDVEQIRRCTDDFLRLYHLTTREQIQALASELELVQREVRSETIDYRSEWESRRTIVRLQIATLPLRRVEEALRSLDAT